ncbi:hypothetical protein GCM10025866_31350 [Naasia aerilata]|uniref:N-acetyltransferase domain-containing protein n=1 Tax=Naasia aerilata TaxID=1162966 RepID=A0ABM8GFU5_9MICO|nr:hypothetical protein GCM10025866_31350 [Naasia aerilata]
MELAPMPGERLDGWMADKVFAYAESREAAGETAEQAHAHAERSMLSFFPEGTPLAGHFVYQVIADDVQVGGLWLGPHPQIPDGRSWWVYDIAILPEYRRRGYGRQAMLLAEEEVRKLGGTVLGLNVFGFNAAAQALYDSLGYGVHSMQMRKRLR